MRTDYSTPIIWRNWFYNLEPVTLNTEIDTRCQDYSMMGGCIAIPLEFISNQIVR